MENRYEFERVTLLSAFAVGEPGKRTFFLAIGQKERWVRVWLEKEQLEALAMAIDQFLFKLSEQHLSFPRGTEEAASSDDAPSGLPAAELEIDEMAIGFTQGIMLKLSGYILGPQREDRGVLDCRTTMAQLERLGKQARKVCAAGRPRCLLCGNPIDPTGHVCPRSN